MNITKHQKYTQETGTRREKEEGKRDSVSFLLTLQQNPKTTQTIYNKHKPRFYQENNPMPIVSLYCFSDLNLQNRNKIT